MTAGKHTPGPWEVLPEECDRPYIRVRGTVLGGRYKVANVVTPVHEGVHARDAEETRANARLIAAAPELLEALDRLANGYPGCRWDVGLAPRLEQARAAIALATGSAS